MSVLSRVVAPAGNAELADVVVALFANPGRPAPRSPLGVPARDGAGPPTTMVHRSFTGPVGLGTSAARIPRAPALRGDHVIEVRGAPPMASGPSGRGTASARIPTGGSAGRESGPELFCPPAIRDDESLGRLVNEGLVDWAEQVGVYPGQLDRLRAADFGRLIMLTHPATDDPDRLMAAGKCIVAEWATDDHFLDDESLGADEHVIGSRLANTYPAIDPAGLPRRYAPQLEQALSDEPVAVAYRSAFDHLSRYASAAQQARLRHELAVMFVAYNQEANWRTAGRIPPVWEYLTHRHQNSFLPPMALVDPIAGYELPADEFADGRVRRAFCLAGTASVVLNDIYSKSKESDADFDLPKVIAAEEGCSPEDALERTVEVHNELMHSFVAEAVVLSSLGSPSLRRFLTDIWAWLGGNREWHSTTARYAATA